MKKPYAAAALAAVTWGTLPACYRASSAIMAAAFPAIIMVGEFVLPEVILISRYHAK